MWRKVSYIFRIIYNMARFPIWSILNGLKIKVSIFEKISPFAHLAVGNDGRIQVGKNCTIENGTIIRSSHGEIIIGNHVFINRNCNLVSHKKISIGEFCTIGPNVCIYDHDHDFRSSDHTKKFQSEKITIGDNVWIASNAIILKGVSIGNNAVIGAGAIVSKDVEENTVFISKHINKIIKF